VSADLVADLGRTYLPGAGRDEPRKQIYLSCEPLIRGWCPQARALNPDAAPTLLLDVARDALSTCAVEDKAARVARAETWSNIIYGALRDPAAAEQPYLTLLYASLLWRLGEYRVAVRELEEWLRRPRGKSGGTADDWYVVRVRTSLVVIFEDWIRSTSNPPVLLLERHLDNVAASMDAMGKLDDVRKAWKALSENGFDAAKEKFSQAPDWRQKLSCSLPSDRRELRLALGHTYLTQLMVFTYRAAQHRDYFDKYLARVLPSRDAFRTINLACVHELQDRTRTDLLYAELLQIYAEVEVANAARLGEDTDADAARKMLQNAAGSAKLGLQILTDEVETERRAAKISTFDATKGGQKGLELQEQLTRVRQLAQDLLRKS
jgi:hypothetical protein